MRALIIGGGRGGTNWTSEILRASGHFRFLNIKPEDDLFARNELCERYAAKIPTEWPETTIRNLKSYMDRYSDLRIVFSLRHPYSQCLSKIYRGQKAKDGGDNKGLAPDASVDGAIYAIEYLFLLYKTLKRWYPSRIIEVKMENLILDIKKEIKRICVFFKIPLNKNMISAHKNVVNSYQQARYGGKIDKSQIDTHKDLDKNYNKFFKDRKKFKIVSKELRHVVFGLGYK